MTILTNPFTTSGYISPEYFCDRENETNKLLSEIENGNNVALISTRRMGKTGLIQHCFQDPLIQKKYNTFFIDIYATKSLRDFVFSLSKAILESLKPTGRKTIEKFWNTLKSIQAGISFDISGTPSFDLQLGDIRTETITLDEIFKYLSMADKPCIVAIDEFQQISGYAEKNIEALLRTYVQHTNNARFIFSGSQRHLMGNIFFSPSRPFYQSVSPIYLNSIDLDKYIEFAKYHFKKGEKDIASALIESIYNQFDGTTWYMQKILNILYGITPLYKKADESLLPIAINNVLDSYKYIYSEMLFRVPEKQKELLIALAREGKAQAITSGDFVQKYKLKSPSSVQAALKGLLEKDFVTHEQGTYQIYDKFFGLWLNNNF